MSFIFEWIYNGFSSVLQFLGEAPRRGSLRPSGRRPGSLQIASRRSGRGEGLMFRTRWQEAGRPGANGLFSRKRCVTPCPALCVQSIFTLNPSLGQQIIVLPYSELTELQALF